MKIFRWGENKRNQIEIIEFRLIVTSVTFMITTWASLRSSNVKQKNLDKLMFQQFKKYQALVCD
jgi:hypothetical protein